MNWLKIGLAFLASSSAASAAEILHEPVEKGFELIAIVGDIQKGDDAKFRRMAAQYPNAVVALSSNGGLLIPALEIGKAIHLMGFATYVPDREVCASSCALIWVAGESKFLAPTGRVGFHATYLEEGGRQIETGVGNALVGRYLTQLELPERSIIFATSAPPSSIRWLGASDRGTSGIDFKILESEETTVSPPPLVQLNTPPPKTLGGWRVSARSPDNKTIHFVNTDEIRRSGTTVQFWDESWWSERVEGVNKAVALFEANCSNKAYRELDRKYFADDEFESQAKIDSNKVSYASPDSMIFGVIESVCESDFETGPVANRAQAVAMYRSHH
ncbi:surface-adhesin E family protein [Sphingomonas alba]|uniref:Surface-adhesin protein E-like domain-containing protein n=1 Tax=Sphingomonas alba TaxID=2908208 RepID=A0ABT0RPH0_9SPHN|nr:surface-adhesin E family protein [Sphingomonas alba]MCL6684463.1 hypothetical protein [Sphingomonas alba]